MLTHLVNPSVANHLSFWSFVVWFVRCVHRCVRWWLYGALWVGEPIRLGEWRVANVRSAAIDIIRAESQNQNSLLYRDAPARPQMRKRLIFYEVSNWDWFRVTRKITKRCNYQIWHQNKPGCLQLSCLSSMRCLLCDCVVFIGTPCRKYHKSCLCVVLEG